MSEKSAKITALNAEQLAKVLSAAGGRRITEEMICADMDAGAPVNPDGTVNLIHYTAWLVKGDARAYASKFSGGGPVRTLSR